MMRVDASCAPVILLLPTEICSLSYQFLPAYNNNYMMVISDGLSVMCIKYSRAAPYFSGYKSFTCYIFAI